MDFNFALINIHNHELFQIEADKTNKKYTEKAILKIEKTKFIKAKCNNKRCFYQNTHLKDEVILLKSLCFELKNDFRYPIIIINKSLVVIPKNNF